VIRVQLNDAIHVDVDTDDPQKAAEGARTYFAREHPDAFRTWEQSRRLPGFFQSVVQGARGATGSMVQGLAPAAELLGARDTAAGIRGVAETISGPDDPATRGPEWRDFTERPAALAGNVAGGALGSIASFLATGLGVGAAIRAGLGAAGVAAGLGSTVAGTAVATGALTGAGEMEQLLRAEGVDPTRAAALSATLGPLIGVAEQGALLGALRRALGREVTASTAAALASRGILGQTARTGLAEAGLEAGGEAARQGLAAAETGNLNLAERGLPVALGALGGAAGGAAFGAPAAMMERNAARQALPPPPAPPAPPPPPAPWLPPEPPAFATVAEADAYLRANPAARPPVGYTPGATPEQPSQISLSDDALLGHTNTIRRNAWEQETNDLRLEAIRQALGGPPRTELEVNLSEGATLGQQVEARVAQGKPIEAGSGGRVLRPGAQTVEEQAEVVLPTILELGQQGTINLQAIEPAQLAEYILGTIDAGNATDAEVQLVDQTMRGLKRAGYLTTGAEKGTYTLAQRNTGRASQQLQPLEQPGTADQQAARAFLDLLQGYIEVEQTDPQRKGTPGTRALSVDEIKARTRLLDNASPTLQDYIGLYLKTNDPNVRANLINRFEGFSQPAAIAPPSALPEGGNNLEATTSPKMSTSNRGTIGDWEATADPEVVAAIKAAAAEKQEAARQGTPESRKAFFDNLLTPDGQRLLAQLVKDEKGVVSSNRFQQLFAGVKQPISQEMAVAAYQAARQGGVLNRLGAVNPNFKVAEPVAAADEFDVKVEDEFPVTIEQKPKKEEVKKPAKKEEPKKVAPVKKPEGKKEEAKKPPAKKEEANERVRGFVTEGGDTYEITSDGSTTKDGKDRSARTVYITDQDARALAPPQGNWRLVQRGDKISLATQNGNQWGVAPSQREIPFNDEPAVGLVPLELWKAQKYPTGTIYREAHFGNPIVDTVSFAAPSGQQGQRTKAEVNEAVQDFYKMVGTSGRLEFAQRLLIEDLDAEVKSAAAAAGINHAISGYAQGDLAVLSLANSSMPLNQVAVHEGWHVAENIGLISPMEVDLLNANLERIRATLRPIAQQWGLDVDTLPPQEVRAYGLNARLMAKADFGFLNSVFDKVKAFMGRIRNFMKGRGFTDWRDAYDSFAGGERASFENAQHVGFPVGQQTFSGTLKVRHGEYLRGAIKKQFYKDTTKSRYDGDGGTFGSDGIYLDINGKWTSGYYTGFSPNHVYEVDATFKNAYILSPATLSDFNRAFGSRDLRGSEIAAELKAAGHDAVIVNGFDLLSPDQLYQLETQQASLGLPDGLLQDQIFSFEPNNLKITSSFSVTNANRAEVQSWKAQRISPVNFSEVMDQAVKRAKVTDTPEFQNWFGTSQVVDNKGRPKIVYHGTTVPAAIEIFKTNVASQLGAHFGSLKAASSFVEADPVNFNSRATDDLRLQIYPVYIKLENPLELEDRGAWGASNVLPQLVKKFGEEAVAPIRAAVESAGSPASKSQALKAGIEQLGYDGIVYANFVEDNGRDSYIAFRPEQIKSAIGNSTFNPADQRIHFAAPSLPTNTAAAHKVVKDHLHGSLTKGIFKYFASPVLTMGKVHAGLAPAADVQRTLHTRTNEFNNETEEMLTEVAGLDDATRTQVTKLLDQASRTEKQSNISALPTEAQRVYKQVQAMFQRAFDYAIEGATIEHFRQDGKSPADKAKLDKLWARHAGKHLWEIPKGELKAASPQGWKAIEDLEKMRNPFYFPQVADGTHFVAAYKKDATGKKVGAPLRMYAYTPNSVMQRMRGQANPVEGLKAELAKEFDPAKHYIMPDGIEFSRNEEAQKVAGQADFISQYLKELKENKGVLSNKAAQEIIGRMGRELDKAGVSRVFKPNQDILRAVTDKNASRYLMEQVPQYLLGLSKVQARWFTESTWTKALEGVGPNDKNFLNDLRDYSTTPTEAFGGLRTAMFFTYLGAAPDTAAMNALQMLQTTMPMMTRDGANPATLLPAANDLRRAGLAAFSQKAGEFGHKVGAAGKNADEKAALDRAGNMGIFSPVFTNESRGQFVSGHFAKMGVANPGRWADKANKMARWAGTLMQAVEQMNRAVTFLAAYREAKAKPEIILRNNRLTNRALAPDDAFSYAMNMVNDTQFLTSKEDRAYIQRFTPAAEVATQFLSFPLKMFELWLKNGHDMLKGIAKADPFLAKSGAVGFIGMAAPIVALAGIWALPGADFTKELLERLMEVWTGDGTQNFDADMRRAIGGGFAADSLLRGIPHATGGMSLSRRLAIDPLPFNDLVSMSIMTLTGPAGSYAESVLKNMPTYWANGDYFNFAASFLPRALGNVVRGAGIAANEEIYTLRGNRVISPEMVAAADSQSMIPAWFRVGFGLQPPSFVNARELLVRAEEIDRQMRAPTERFNKNAARHMLRMMEAAQTGDAERGSRAAQELQELIQETVERNAREVDQGRWVNINMQAVQRRALNDLMGRGSTDSVMREISPRNRAALQEEINLR
jgi:hypothetical protein